MEQFLILALIVVVVFLVLKNRQLLDKSHTPRKISKAKPTSNTSTKTKKCALPQLNHPSLNTGIAEIDGPGMYQRLTGCGPQGHVCYLLFSKTHKAYKVGICKPERLGLRIKSIRGNVPDTNLVGTAVFTSHQNAYNKEQAVLSENRRYRYRGITGKESGSSEWITRKPSSSRPVFATPEFVEQRYQQQSEAPLQRLEIPDKYTIYLAYSKAKNAYKVKWCVTENLHEKLVKLQREAPDAEIISRIKIGRPGMAREITLQMNSSNGTYSREGREDIIKWSTNPIYLAKFDNWDVNGNRK
ncbi:hypothetical protein OAK65_03705 [Synechococcus sp. AH-551-N17]|nr:hypothetical protein [Synechococcus sp. AH-551-N17]